MKRFEYIDDPNRKQTTIQAQELKMSKHLKTNSAKTCLIDVLYSGDSAEGLASDAPLLAYIVIFLSTKYLMKYGFTSSCCSIFSFVIVCPVILRFPRF